MHGSAPEYEITHSSMGRTLSPNHQKSKRFISALSTVMPSPRSLLQNCALIDELKNFCQIKHPRHRFPFNFAVNLLAGLVAYCPSPDKPKLPLQDFRRLSKASLIISCPRRSLATGLPSAVVSRRNRRESRAWPVAGLHEARLATCPDDRQRRRHARRRNRQRPCPSASNEAPSLRRVAAGR